MTNKPATPADLRNAFRARFRTARPRAQLLAGRTKWYSMQADSGGDVTVIRIFDEIGYFGTTSADFVAELDRVTTSKIHVCIDSPGGSAFDGVAIYNSLRRHPAHVTTIVEGMAASAASMITMAGNKIMIGVGAMIMIHDPMTIAIGNPREIRKTADDLEDIADTFSQVYAEKADGTAAEWREIMRQEVWFGPEQALELGLADEMQKRNGDEDDEGDSSDHDMTMFAGATEWSASLGLIRPDGAADSGKLGDEYPNFDVAAFAAMFNQAAGAQA